MLINNIQEFIGNTPLIRLNKITTGVNASILAKCEFLNPGSSVKDRLALALIEHAVENQLIKPDTILLEPTSGNTGIGLAMLSALKGYALTLVMPETASIERRKLMAQFGASLILTPGQLGMQGAIDKALDLKNSDSRYVILSQFDNPSNAKIHERTTGPEIWKDTNGKIDIFVAAVGTGGTFTGTSRFLKGKNPVIKTIAVEPKESAVLSGNPAQPHKIQGIGAGFIPKVLDTTLIDEIVQIDYQEAGEMARKLAREEGLLVGISAGANVAAALKVANRLENIGKTVVTVLCDTGERYVSTWLFE